MRRTRRLPLEQLQPYLLDVPKFLTNTAAGSPAFLANAATKLDWNAVFANVHPVEVEIGFGKGMFLVNAAQAQPATNFLGIEIERKYQLYTANRLAKRRLGNVRVTCADARTFLCDHVPAGSVRAIHIYFPDPWWKQRHRKRRLFNDEFAAQCVRTLAPGGRLVLASDVQDYFAAIQQLLDRHTELQLLPAPQVNEPQHDLDYLTNFERKYRQDTRPIYRAAYEKRAS